MDEIDEMILAEGELILAAIDSRAHPEAAELDAGISEGDLVHCRAFRYTLGFQDTARRESDGAGG
jgi:hypothetical protein